MTNRGLKGWIEVFRGGRQEDAAGNMHDGDELIDRALSGFDPRTYQPPVVVGHPRDNHPAYGWVSALRRGVKDGVAVLEARLTQVSPLLEEAVRLGRYKKRSAGFFTDGRLRHIGFLGAFPPAVEGLADPAFQSAAGAFEFAQNPGPEIQKENDMTFAELLKALRHWLKTGALPESFLQKPDRPESRESDQDRAARFDQAVARAAADAEKRMAAEKRGQDVEKRVDDLVREGKLPPAVVDLGLKNFLKDLHGQNSGWEFASSEGRRRQTPMDFILALLDLLEKLDLFRSQADRAAADSSAGPAAAKSEEALGQSIADKVNPPARAV
jgi:hypothetical protein